MAAIFRLSDVTQPKLKCINKITSFLLFISTSIVFSLIHLLKTVDFEKKSVEFALQMEILLAFQNLNEVN